MHFFDQIDTESRLFANLIAVHLVLLVLFGLSLVLRWLVTHSGKRLAGWTNGERLKQFSAEATRHGHTLLFWLTVTAMTLSVVGGVVYHVMGGDARGDLNEWYSQLTSKHFIRMAEMVGGLIILAIVASVLVRIVRRVLPALENFTMARLGHPKNEETLRHWFRFLKGFAIFAVRLETFHVAGHVLHVGYWSNIVFGFILRMVCTVAVARLLILACRATPHVLADYGTTHFNKTRLHRYWERITRLLPFGVRCCETAIYVGAASLVVKEFNKIAQVVEFGEGIDKWVALNGSRIVECIGIFFCARVIIELLQVLLNEAFGMYRPDGALDQKGRTLVPLLHSVCQYVLYFGAGVMMLDLFTNTTPILAGAGILGLGVGLGAQSLVTDVVSGFFILFENQFLVGDYVSLGDAAGIVEEVSLRVTKIRDGKGKLHIIPNGQIKGVVSYSKEYVNAVVEVKMPAGSDLESLFRAMKEAGRRLRAEHKEVLADTELHGLVEWSPSDMTIRAVTKVQAGTHGAMQNEYRRHLKQVFDEKQALARPALAA